MAALTGQTIALSYEQLLHVDRDDGGNGTTHVSVKDGDNGTTFGFTIASNALMMTSTNQLQFGDTGTYIFQSADGVLDLVSDNEIELNATTLDINANADISGTLLVSGAATFSVPMSCNNITMTDDTSIGISDSDERIEFDGAGDISVMGANFGIETLVPAFKFEVAHGAAFDADGIRFGRAAYATGGTGNTSSIKFGTDDLGHSRINMYNVTGGLSSRIAGSNGTGGDENCTWFTDGVRIGADSANNAIDDSITGGSTTPLYIGAEAIDTTLSDARMKNVVDEIPMGLEDVNKLKVHTFTWKNDEDKDEIPIITGMMAQEVFEQYPWLVKKPSINPEEIGWAIKYNALVPILAKAIQELSTKVTALENA